MKSIIHYVLRNADKADPAYAEALRLAAAYSVDVPVEAEIPKHIDVAIYVDLHVSMREVYQIPEADLEEFAKSVEVISDSIVVGERFQTCWVDGSKNDPALITCDLEKYPSIRLLVGDTEQDWNEHEGNAAYTNQISADYRKLTKAPDTTNDLPAV
jgi:hypothetical protein